MNRYKYDRVKAVITSIEAHTDWDVAKNTEELHFFSLRAAYNVNVFEPFTDEQNELMQYLSLRQAGRRLCDYAWRLLAQSY
ncbi:MAG: hypothetical protein ABJG88_01345 [Litorimonas sp.]